MRWSFCLRDLIQEIAFVYVFNLNFARLFLTTHYVKKHPTCADWEQKSGNGQAAQMENVGEKKLLESERNNLTALNPTRKWGHRNETDRDAVNLQAMASSTKITGLVPTTHGSGAGKAPSWKAWKKAHREKGETVDEAGWHKMWEKQVSADSGRGVSGGGELQERNKVFEEHQKHARSSKTMANWNTQFPRGKGTEKEEAWKKLFSLASSSDAVLGEV